MVKCVGQFCRLFLRRAWEQSGFREADRRMQCVHRPTMWRSALDFGGLAKLLVPSCKRLPLNFLQADFWPGIISGSRLTQAEPTTATLLHRETQADSSVSIVVHETIASGWYSQASFNTGSADAV